MNDLIWYVTIALIVVATCYGGSRAASIAFFRTKLEYFKAMIREGARPNGEE